MDQAFRDVMEFHRAMAPHLIGSTPKMPDDEGVKRMRRDLVFEEFVELDEAIYREDLPGIADACADLIYVVIGAAITCGIDLRPVWQAVQAANMAKAGGPVREDGKILKKPGWTPPDIAGILGRQAPLTIETFRSEGGTLDA